MGQKSTRNLIGQRFGHWLVAGPRREGKHHRWLAQCSCGVQKWVLEISLVRGRSNDCGCLNKIGFVSLAGRRFGAWTVTQSYRRHGKNIQWLCHCKCGAEKWIVRTELVNGRTTSCLCEGKLRRAEKNRKPNAGAEKVALFHTYRYGAKRRHLSFRISLTEFTTITSLPCAYCGIPPRSVKRIPNGGPGYVYNGIDRADPSRGYELDNILPCCIDCNRAKWQKSPREFHDWLARIYKHQFQPDAERPLISEAIC